MNNLVFSEVTTANVSCSEFITQASYIPNCDRQTVTVAVTVTVTVTVAVTFFLKSAQNQHEMTKKIHTPMHAYYYSHIIP
jgi:hypothetical protein